MKKVWVCLYALLIIFAAFLAGLECADKDYFMMIVDLIGALCWYGCSYLNSKHR